MIERIKHFLRVHNLPLTVAHPVRGLPTSSGHNANMKPPTTQHAGPNCHLNCLSHLIIHNYHCHPEIISVSFEMACSTSPQVFLSSPKQAICCDRNTSFHSLLNLNNKQNVYK